MGSMEWTLAVIKPDAIRMGKAEEIKHIIEQHGFTICAQHRQQLTEERARAFYAEHVEAPFYERLVEFMTSGPVETLVLCKQDCIKAWRALIGPTNVFKARADSPYSLRAQFGTDGLQNAAHGSDSSASAEREIRFFYPDLELSPPAQAQGSVEWTFALIKPDAVRKGKAQEIKQLIEMHGFTIIAQQKVQLTRMRAEEFYAEHHGKPFFGGLIDFMTSGPAWALVLCRRNAIKAWRATMGPTNCFKAREEAPRSLRALYGTDGTQNATHGSDSRESAAREIKFFFPTLVLEPLMDGEEAKAYITKQLQPALAKALTALAREKPSAEKFEAITFLANYLLANNPNKPRIITPEEWDPSMEEEDDEAEFAHAKLRAAEFGEAGASAADAYQTVEEPPVAEAAAVPAPSPAKPVAPAYEPEADIARPASRPASVPAAPAPAPPPRSPAPPSPPPAAARGYGLGDAMEEDGFGLSAVPAAPVSGSFGRRADLQADEAPKGHAASVAPPDDLSSMNEAATKVQAAFKGHQARKQVQQMRVEEQMHASAASAPAERQEEEYGLASEPAAAEEAPAAAPQEAEFQEEPTPEPEAAAAPPPAEEFVEQGVTGVHEPEAPLDGDALAEAEAAEQVAEAQAELAVAEQQLEQIEEAEAKGDFSADAQAEEQEMAAAVEEGEQALAEALAEEAAVEAAVEAEAGGEDGAALAAKAVAEGEEGAGAGEEGEAEAEPEASAAAEEADPEGEMMEAEDA